MTTPAETTATVKFTLELDVATNDKLVHLSKITHFPKAVILRRAIDAHHAHVLENSPRCANSDACRCPQTHYVQPMPHYGPPANAVPPGATPDGFTQGK